MRPPIFTMASFLALMVKLSAYLNISLTISLIELFLNSSSLVFIKYAFSAKRAASILNNIPYFFATSAVSRIFCIDTAWPPAELFVTVITIIPTFSLPHSSMVSSSFLTSILPLNGAYTEGFLASSQTQSTGFPPDRVTWALVVSKNIFDIAICPFFITVGKNTFSAARPWCTGWIKL